MRLPLKTNAQHTDNCGNTVRHITEGWVILIILYTEV